MRWLRSCDRVIVGAVQLFLPGQQPYRDIMATGSVTALTLLYPFEGGMGAVIWTEVIQLLIYLWRFIIVAFTWFVVFGSVVTFAIGYTVSLFVPTSAADGDLQLASSATEQGKL